MRYIDVHRSIKEKPADVTKVNEDKIWDVLYGNTLTGIRRAKHKFKVGDKVRISKLKRKFEKRLLIKLFKRNIHYKSNNTS